MSGSHTGGMVLDEEFRGPSFERCLQGSVGTACCFEHKACNYNDWAPPLNFISVFSMCQDNLGPRPSSVCLPSVYLMLHDKISQTFILCVCILEAIKYWRWERQG